MYTIKNFNFNKYLHVARLGIVAEHLKTCIVILKLSTEIFQRRTIIKIIAKNSKFKHIYFLYNVHTRFDKYNRMSTRRKTFNSNVWKIHRFTFVSDVRNNNVKLKVRTNIRNRNDIFQRLCGQVSSYSFFFFFANNYKAITKRIRQNYRIKKNMNLE